MSLAGIAVIGLIIWAILARRKKQRNAEPNWANQQGAFSGNGHGQSGNGYGNNAYGNSHNGSPGGYGAGAVAGAGAGAYPGKQGYQQQYQGQESYRDERKGHYGPGPGENGYVQRAELGGMDGRGGGMVELPTEERAGELGGGGGRRY